MTDPIIEFGRSLTDTKPIKVAVRWPVYSRMDTPSEGTWFACWNDRHTMVTVHVALTGAVSIQINERFQPDPTTAAELYLGHGQFKCDQADFNQALAHITGLVARAQHGLGIGKGKI
jgi:hypothetical protein